MTKKHHKYATYQLFDFLLDADFKQWVLHPSSGLDEFWHSVIAENPSQYRTIQKAIQIIRNLPVVDETTHSERKNLLWKEIEARLSDEPQIRTKKLKLSFVKYAAAILIVIGTVYGFWFYQHKTVLIYIATGNGENKSVQLPDGSHVLLAPNSSISYHKNFTENKSREIWAKGDAKFDVRHINQNPKYIKKGERFVVHLDQKVDVEVLGTVFSISNRRGLSSVALLSGSVKVNRDENALLLKPGESVVSEINKKLTLSRQPLPVVRVWEQHIATLNRTSVHQIIELIKDTYGVELNVDDNSILQKELDGVLPLNDREKALQILTSITGTNLYEKNGVYLLKEIR
jgi:ferric-dicitrate binding protein FerR (iron transport regulator)